MPFRVSVKIDIFELIFGYDTIMKNITISDIAILPTAHGTLRVQAFKELDKEHLAIFTPIIPDNPIVRIHSECLTGDALGSLKCDCGEQLRASLEAYFQGGWHGHLPQTRGQKHRSTQQNKCIRTPRHRTRYSRGEPPARL